MSLEETISAAVTPYVPEFSADVYTGESDNYCVLNITEIPDQFGDDQPLCVRCLAQLHWYFPLRMDPRQVKKEIREAIGGLDGCTWPTVTDATDLDGGHLAFEFEAVEDL